MSTPRFTVAVDVPVVVRERRIYVVVDEDDLKTQLAADEQKLKDTLAPSKPDRDKKGATMMFQMGKDWDLP